MKVVKISDYEWEIPKGELSCMKVPARIFASEKLIEKMKQDRTLLQAAGVACLPGIYKYSIVLPDGHEGYGFPIGGVAAIDAKEGVISPGGIGYDINCLSPGSKVLTEHGYWLNIEELPKKLNHTVKVYDVNEGHNDGSDILFVAERDIEANEVAIRITTETGKMIEGSIDHPILTPNGYVSMGNIKEGDEIVTYPFEGVEFEDVEGTVLSKKDFDGESKQVIKYLEKRGLLPLYWNDSKLGIIAKILGFGFGNANLGKMGNRCVLIFYGKKDTLVQIKKDLERIGIKSKLYVRKRNYSVKNTSGKYKKESIFGELRVGSISFVKLMEKLGMPKGKKIERLCFVPEWIKKAPLWIKRNFLAGLFGSDGSIVEFKGNKPLPITLTQSKIPKLENNLKQFLLEIAKLLEEFGIKTTIYSVNSRKNATYILSIDGENSIKNFLAKINYEYDLKKKERGLHAYAYLKFKTTLKKERVEDGILAKSVHSNTRSISADYKEVKGFANTSLVEEVIYSHVENYLVPESFPDFNKFLKEKCYVGGFVSEKVVKVERIKPKYKKFYDLGVLHKAHNFIANGIVVHNCGVRLLRTDLTVDDVRPKLKELLDTIFKNVPSGVGRGGKVKISISELDEVLARGVEWAVENGYGIKEDLKHIEENGRMKYADPNYVSDKAKKRGSPQLGSLGAGNHFLEIQVVDKIFNPEVAKTFGIEKEGQVMVMIHTGSRGLGHQVCSDFLKIMENKFHDILKNLPDRELIYAPVNSEIADNYFKAMSAAANFAWTNRQMIMHWTRESFRKVFDADPLDDLGMRLVYDVAHNIAKLEEHIVDGKKVKVYVHRKGATRSFPAGREEIPSDYRSVGQPVLIPGSMGTASYVLVGTETAMQRTFGSTAHGAGRAMSRSKALKKYRGEKISKELESRGILVRAASWRVVAEEAPLAYKNIDEVVRVSDSVGIGKLVARLRPIGVVKG